MSADSWLSAAPSQARTVRYSLQCLLAFLAVTLAFESRPTPENLTLWVTFIEWGLLFALRSWLAPAAERWRHLAPTVLIVVVLGALVVWGGPFELRSLDPVWIAWCGIPVALLLDPSSLRFGQRLPVPFGLMILASVAVGLAGSQPWTREAGWWLLILFACNAVVLFVFSFSETLEHRARRSGVISTRCPPAPVASLGRFGLGLSSAVLASAALVSMLLWAAVDLLSSPRTAASGLEPVSSADDRWADEESSEEEWDPLNVEDLMHSANDRSVVAEVRATQGGEGVTRPLYLREHVLDEYHREAAVPFLRRKQGPLTVRLDPHDGELDGAVGFRGLEDRGFTGNVSPPTQLTQISNRRRGGPCLYEPHLVWMAERSLEIGPDASIFARRASDPMLVGSCPDLYFADGFPEAAASRTGPTEVPRNIEDGPWLERISRELLRGRNDLDRVRNLAAHLRETCKWQLPPSWDGSYRRFLEGERAAVCAHFAQTAALLSRLSGIPARVAVGYIGREYDSDRQVYVIRGRHRHAWLEVEFRDLGWVGFEVTPPTQDGSGDVVPAPVVGGPDSASSSQPRSAETDAVVASTASLSEIRGALPPKFVWWAAILAGAVLAWVLCAPARLRAGSEVGAAAAVITPTARRAGGILTKLENICRRHGLRRGIAETPSHFIARVAGRVPESHDPLRELNDLYHESRFGGRDLTPQSASSLRRFLSALPAVLADRQRAIERGPPEDPDPR